MCKIYIMQQTYKKRNADTIIIKNYKSCKLLTTEDGNTVRFDKNNYYILKEYIFHIKSIGYEDTTKY